MGAMRESSRWSCRAGLWAVLLALCLVVPSSAQTNGNGIAPVTAKITLGPRDGAARPMKRGQSVTGGGNIDVSQPAPDTLVIRMTGNVGACGHLLAAAEAALDFYENLQFAVEFSQPGHMGKLLITSTVNGALSGRGKQSVVGMGEAVVSVAFGPNPIASLAIPARAVGCDDSMAINASQGPVCAPVVAGCYQLSQTFRIFAAQPKGCSCGKAIGEFSPSALSSTWIGSSYPFQQVDKSGFGYQVTIRVVPDPIAK